MGSWQTPAASTEVGTRETGDVDVATRPPDVPVRLQCLSYGFLRGQFAAAQGLSCCPDLMCSVLLTVLARSPHPAVLQVSGGGVGVSSPRAVDGGWSTVHHEGSGGQRAQLHLRLPIAPHHSHHRLSHAPAPSVEKLSA